MLDRYPTYAEFAAGADQAVLAEPGAVWELTVITDGTNAAEATVFDGPAANNKILAHVKQSGAGLFARARAYQVKATTSIHITVTGTGAKAGVYYSK